MAVRDPKRTRGFTVPASVLTGDWSEVVHDPQVQIVVELMGGTTTAREVVRAALKLGKPVVTANKALLSAHGPELFALAAKHRTNLYYEAAVAGGIPIIKALRESFAGNRITRIAGIVNGTCNYILTRMKLEGAEFSEVLADAQRLGYAEAEPSLDIDGHDAAHKIGILASLAHGFWVRPEAIHTEGIRHLSKLDIQFAGQLGYTIKLLGIIQPVASAAPSAAKKGRNTKKAPDDGQASGIQVSVYPALSIVGGERGHTVVVAGAQVERGIGQVAQHRTGGGVLAGAPAVEQGVPHGVAPHGHRIEGMVHRGQHMGVGDEGRVHRHLDA
jgi:homoserine dehydrogenase